MKAKGRKEVDFSFSTEYVFNNRKYICTINTVNKKVLVVSVEDGATGNRWRGEFSASSIEAVTGKTGNFKKFSVFVRMLHHSLTQKSGTVQVELLTRSELELLFRKNLSSTSTTSKSRNFGKSSNQRYLILTYSVEFDRVHYPLPLAFQKPTVDRLQKTISDLRSRLSSKPLGGEKQGEEVGSMEGEIERLRRENLEIRAEMTQQRSQMQALRKQRESEMSTFQKEIEVLGTDMESQEVEVSELRARLRKADSKSDLELKRKVKELRGMVKRKEGVIGRKNKELEKLRYEVKRLKGKTKRLEMENERLGRRIGSQSQRARRSPRVLGGKKKFVRFNPTEYIKEKRRKSTSARGNVRRSNSAYLGRRKSSLTRSGRSRSRSRTRSSSRSNSKTRRGRSRSRSSSRRRSSRSRSGSRTRRARSRSRSSSRRASRESSVERKIESFRKKRRKRQGARKKRSKSRERSDSPPAFDPEELKKRLMELRERHSKKKREINHIRSSRYDVLNTSHSESDESLEDRK